MRLTTGEFYLIAKKFGNVLDMSRLACCGCSLFSTPLDAKTEWKILEQAHLPLEITSAEGAPFPLVLLSRRGTNGRVDEVHLYPPQGARIEMGDKETQEASPLAGRLVVHPEPHQCD